MCRLSATSLSIVLFALSTNWAYGCPYCDSAIGRQVWSGIFNGAFFWNATLVALPILVLAAIVLAIRFAPLPGLTEPQGIVAEPGRANHE